MRTIGCVVAVLVLLVGTSPSLLVAAPVGQLVVDKAPFCAMLSGLLAEDVPPHDIPERAGGTIPQSSRAQFEFETPDGRTLTDDVGIWRIDIDNNGHIDTVIHKLTGYAGGLVSYLLIARDRELPVGERTFSASEVASLVRIGAYESEGLYGPHIVPFDIGGTIYLLLFDDWFSPKGQPGRSVVIAKFTGEKLKSRTHWTSTYDIQIVCKVQLPQGRKPTSNRRLQGTPIAGASEPER